MYNFCTSKITFFIMMTLICIIALYILLSRKKSKLFPQDVSATEDLMREHGLLNRILLIYEEVIKRIEHNDIFPAAQLARALEIVKKFIEEYHEKIEEDHIFPLFEKHNVEVELVTTLREQHVQGRAITSRLQTLVMSQQNDKQSLNDIQTLLHQFIDMYRPHESREDTIVFPRVRSLVTEEEYAALAEMCEDTEDQIFGEHGFELLLNQVESIEKDLEIYELK